jgi:ribosomal protein S10
VAALDEKNTYKRAFDLITGDDSVVDALQKI